MSEQEGQQPYQQAQPGQPQPVWDEQAQQWVQPAGVAGAQQVWDEQAQQWVAAGAAQPQAAQHTGAIRAQQTGPIPADMVAAAKSGPSGFSGMFNDPSELASTGFLFAELLAIVAGVLNFLSDPGLGGEFKHRLLQLTDTVDVGDVALIGIGVALLIVTPDPPGGLGRPRLLNVAAVLAAIIAVFGVIKSMVILFEDIEILNRLAQVLATLGVAAAAATVAFYAAKESFLKAEEKAEEKAAA